MFQTILITGGSREEREAHVNKLLTSNRAVPGYVFEIKPEKASDQIKIEDIREIQSSLYLKPPGGITMFAVLYELHQATIAAQNSLLKLLEEPPPHLRIVMTASSDRHVLPTITSRSRVLTIEARPWHRPVDEITTYTGEYEALKTMNIGKRFELAARISDSPEHVREWLQHMLIAARAMLHQETGKGSANKITVALQKLANCLVTIKRTNTNQRLLIENLLLEIPAMISCIGPPVVLK